MKVIVSLLLPTMLLLDKTPLAAAKHLRGRERKLQHRVAMITGDHKDTALAIGTMLGLVDEEHSEAITGPELDAMNDEDISIQGIEASQIMILVDDNFATIVAAVGSGNDLAPSSIRGCIQIATIEGWLGEGDECRWYGVECNSAGSEKGDFLVQEEQGNRVTFDLFEEAFNYISNKGYSRMSREDEKHWVDLMNVIHDSVKGGMKYNTGTLLLGSTKECYTGTIDGAGSELAMGDPVSLACPCDGQNNDPWKNHGDYVTCVTKVLTILRDMQIIRQTKFVEEKSRATSSSCGKKSDIAVDLPGGDFEIFNP